MKRLLLVGLLSAGAMGLAASTASAAPLTRSATPSEATSTVELVQHRRHYRDGRRYYRHHYYGPRAYYGPRRHYGYRPYYRDYYYGGPAVSIGVPGFGLHIGPRRGYYGYW